MSDKTATIVMVPRERYSAMVNAIESLYEHTPTDRFDLIVVDGAVPPVVRAKVEALAARHGFRFDHREAPLSPNEARNIGLAQTTTPYIVFVDNDLIFTDGWLETLIDTAREFDAWLVGPTVLEGPDDAIVIHSAAGTSSFDRTPGKRHYYFMPDFEKQTYEAARPQMQRGPVTMLEFHVLLARTDIFERLGPLDAAMIAAFDHDDITHLALEGGAVIFEPDAIVRYHNPGRETGLVEKSDRAYWALRWSDDWAAATVDHVVRKWRIDADDTWPAHMRDWVRFRRRMAYREFGWYGRLTGIVLYRVSRRLGQAMERIMLRRITSSLRSLRKPHRSTPASPTAALRTAT